MTTTSPPKTGGLRMLVGTSVCILANAVVMYGVLQSPYGSLGYFDDSPTTSDWLLPTTAGAVLGFLQTWGFGVRATLIAACVTALLGALSFVFLFPAVLCAIGCVVGAFIAFVFGVRSRRNNDRWLA